MTSERKTRDGDVSSLRSYGSFAKKPGGRIDPMEILRGHAALGALHNATEHFDPPKCHQNTLKAVQDRIDRWAKDRSPKAKQIFWLSGSVRGGRSAIAHTMIERWRKENLISPAFIFANSGPELNHKTSLIPTITFQLSKVIPSLKNHNQAVIEQASVFRESLRSQVEKLIVIPLNTIFERRPVIIVMDGLDECCADLPSEARVAQQREILEAIHVASQKAPYLRFLVTSKAESHISEALSSTGLGELTVKVLLPESSGSQEDIDLFLECSFEEIRQLHPHLPPSWPSKEQLSFLVPSTPNKSLYASVIIRFIKSHNHDPDEQLERLLELHAEGNKDRRNLPLSELDTLYAFILGSVECLPVVQDILGYLCYKNTLLSAVMLPSQGKIQDGSPSFLARALFLSVRDIYESLDDLHPILDIPPPEQIHNSITLLDPTLSQFLTDESRSGYFFIDAKTTFLRQASLLLRHVEKYRTDKSWLASGNTTGPSPTWYTRYGMNQMVEECARRAPRSADLMQALWKLMQHEIGRYPKGFKFTYREMTSSRVDSTLGFLSRDTKLQILNYLRACNISQIQPSWWRRCSVRRCLAPAISYYKRESKLASPLNHGWRSDPVQRSSGLKLNRYFASSWDSPPQAIQS